MPFCGGKATTFFPILSLPLVSPLPAAEMQSASQVDPPTELPDCPSTDTSHQTWKTSEGFRANASGNPIEPAWTRSRLKIPRDDMTVFARPDWPTASELAHDNADQFHEATLAIHGRPLTELRQSARKEVLSLALNFTSNLLGEAIPEESISGLLFCSGHQPTLFHPGVWIKNFAIHHFAQSSSGMGLNLVIDNDIVAHRQIRVPIGNREKPATEALAFDSHQPACPWEEARIASLEEFASCGARAAKAMEAWQVAPLVSQMWPDAVAEARRSRSLRDALTIARMKLERRWGLTNLEVPLSQVCETEAFCWFASAILTRLPKFWETYNSVLEEFRRVNRIRSLSHPVPALLEKDGWFEAPFWVWEQGGRKRQRVMAKACSQEVRLSNGQAVFARLPISADGDLTAAASILGDLRNVGLRFRTRALTTTLFARLCLADLFVHGIGGAKYDEMTDRLMARFFGLKPPGFLTLSASVHLPLAEPHVVSTEEEQAFRHRLRDIQWNPERHLLRGSDPQVDQLMSEKQGLIAKANLARTSVQTRSERKRNRDEAYQRHKRLKGVTSELVRYAEADRLLLESNLAEIQKELAANAILQSREFSFALYPEEKLRPFLSGLGHQGIS
jgi:hypothetical protein